MLLARQIHAYVAIFIAPSVLFFALTGSLQLFNLHEDHGSYQAPAAFVSLASLHKDQVKKPHEDHDDGPPSAAAPEAPKAASAAPADHDDDDAPKNTEGRARRPRR